jgi:pentatricopeptide repeat protein
MLVREIVHNIYVGTTLVSMYTKCARAADARMVFDEMPSRNVFSWNAMITGFAISGFCNEALVVYNQMKQAGTQPDNFNFPCVFKACAALGDLQQGRENHGYVIRSGFEFDVFVGSSLVDMYAKCGNLEDAHQVFDKMSQRDLVSWNVMISIYAAKWNL